MPVPSPDFPRAKTPRGLPIPLSETDSFQFVIDLPRVVYDAYPVGVPGKDRLTVQFSGIARFKTTSDTSADFRLTSTRSNY